MLMKIIVKSSRVDFDCAFSICIVKLEVQVHLSRSNV